MDLKQELKRFVKRGEFVLISGDKTNVYFNLREAYGYPELLNVLAEELYKIIDKEANCVACIGVGGSPLASVLSSKYGLKLVIVRDKIKDHGTKNLIEGHIPGLNDKVAIVDDVFTVGTSSRKIIEVLSQTPAKILGCYVVVKRGEGEIPVQLRYLYTLNDLI